MSRRLPNTHCTSRVAVFSTVPALRSVHLPVQEELRRVFRLRPDGTFPSPRSNDPGVAAAAGPGPADAAAADAAPADAVAATAHGAGPHSTSRNTSTSPTDTTTATDAAISAAPESAAAGGGERASNLSSAVAQGPQGQGPGPAQVPGDSYAEAGAAAGSRQGPGAEMAGTGAGIAAHTEMGLLDSDEDNEDEDIWMVGAAWFSARLGAAPGWGAWVKLKLRSLGWERSGLEANPASAVDGKDGMAQPRYMQYFPCCHAQGGGGCTSRASPHAGALHLHVQLVTAVRLISRGMSCCAMGGLTMQLTMLRLTI